MTNPTQSFAIAVACVAVAVSLTPSARGCAAVFAFERRVTFGDQTNIIVWDADHKIEHFVRNARFNSNATDFGFIAPTPTKPKLSNSSKDAFQTLADLQPRRPMMRAEGGRGGAPTAAAPAPVQVIQVVDVAGYRATTLLASDANALASWMRSNGYQTTPGIVQWTRFYIAKGWYLTAFKVRNLNRVATTGTVRMSFKTDRPFNPFFVPKDNFANGPGGSLRVYFVSNQPARPLIGSNPSTARSWEYPLWSAAVPVQSANRLASELRLPAAAIPVSCQVTAYEDDAFPRMAADDIYFMPVGRVSARPRMRRLLRNSTYIAGGDPRMGGDETSDLFDRGNQGRRAQRPAG